MALKGKEDSELVLGDKSKSAMEEDNSPMIDSLQKSSPPQRNLKRKHEPDGDSCKLAKKAMALMTSGVTPQNALCILHQMYRDLIFNIVNQEGPVHSPVFTATVEINGIVYEGKGKNKKKAKHSAAEAALRSLIQFKNPCSEGPNLSSSSDINFSNDVLYKEMNNFDASRAEGTNIIIPNTDTASNGLKLGKPNSGNLKPSASEKNPVMLLNELYPNAKYEVVSDNGEQSCKYTMALIINGQRFEEKGSSKKSSKAAVARSALLSFHNVSIPVAPAAEVPTPNLVSKRESGVPQAFADNISRMINDKFAALMKNDAAHLRRKVLAGFVLSKDYNLESCKVITVSTGTKCVNGERMSVNGTVLNDSHAEVVSRRCLRNFFYSELEKLLNNNTDDSIFEQSGNGFRLKSRYKFHLYINTAPCGDSRIFSPHDEYHVDKHPNRKARGKLRTKIECGEGTIPIVSGAVQTWDGVLQGERLLTMSCSDKIAKWNVLGLQGALLSNFIEPIYLDSIILGSLFHPEHLRRAVCGRVESTIQGLPPPFRLNEPKLSVILNRETRQVGKSPNFSINWTEGDEDVEIVNAASGKTEQNEISRLSKCRLFCRFLRLAKIIPSITGFKITEKACSYIHCKLAATDYQIAKRQLFIAFSKAKLGTWVKKPEEVDSFEWE